MGKKLSQVCLTTTLFLISLALIFVITAAQGGPGKIAVQGHPSPSAHSAVGQNPPSDSRHAHLSYEGLKSQIACNETRSRSCFRDLNPPVKKSCDFGDRSCRP
nr:hypothetical protein Iba_chr13cCG0740 [Ipomoea batatas]